QRRQEHAALRGPRLRGQEVAGEPVGGELPAGARQGLRPRADAAAGVERDARRTRQEPPRRDRARHGDEQLMPRTPGPLARAFLPNRAVPSPIMLGLTLGWAGLGLLLWLLSPWQTLPGPGEVWGALGSLWWEHGMGPELWTTLRLILHALALTVV